MCVLETWREIERARERKRRERERDREREARPLSQR